MLSRLRGIYRAEGPKPFIFLLGQGLAAITALAKFSSLSYDNFREDTGSTLWGIGAALLALLLATLIFYTIKAFAVSHPMIFDSEGKDIEGYMYDLIKKGGKVAVFSRTLSWAKNSEELKQLLFDKAADGSLTIVVPKKFDLVNELESADAEIIVCPLFENFNIRFTITNLGTVGVGVATGMSAHGTVSVEHYTDFKRQPMVSMAITTLNLVKGLANSNSGGNP